MVKKQITLANEIISYLKEFPFTKSCNLHGSLSLDKYDEYSDIDIQIDVSGSDNGKILLMLPYLINKKFPLAYTAFAPRFAPDLYVVSIAILDENIFHFIDIECIASPHISSLSKDEILNITDFSALKLKLLIGCLKKYLRGIECSEEIKFIIKDSSSDKISTMLEKAFQDIAINSTDTIKAICEKSIEYLNSADNEL